MYYVIESYLKRVNWMVFIMGGILGISLSYTYLFDWMFPDICYYHTHEIHPLTILFYSFSAENNGHPAPNLLNLLLSFLLGGVMSNGVHYKLLSFLPSSKKKDNLEN